MRNVKVVVVLAVLIAAGCGGDGSPSGSPPFTPSTEPSSASVTASATPSVTASPPASTPVGPPPQSSAPPLPGATAVPAEQVDGSALPDAYRREAWVSPDGRTVQVAGLAGGCKRASAEVEAQSADQVLITLVTTYHRPEGGVCTEELFPVPVDVTLDAPLGDRRIVLEARERTA
ncbi:hypothetical protein [Saccharothrix algeriensis]|uniref:Secreted protein n=1 Tax=Saccharothrix algeriensis TaxID=173560 RepID=A0A8T8I1M0_9PSEU|nr:hypothetical protein [Saccharothrix algeriensis]MBM7810667.1 hypothetical protein [Saccharothrix algeriensis]QTR04745.1 hypothetical protein J7S33_07970 [Saccharothrix algeriensis]